MLPTSSVQSILKRIKGDICALPQHNVVEFVLFGSAVKNAQPRDIDIALIVEDKTDLFEFTRAISPIVAAQTAASGLLISCFPIRREKYLRTSSQFVSNVQSHGRKF